MATSFVDILFLIAVILFITGFLGVFIRPIRKGLKTVHKKFRLRHLFIGSLLCFTLSLAMGWEDAVKGFNDGLNEARHGGSNYEQTEIEP